ncbi:hypothetical protein QBC35DRAFT_29413 [Podospora australis]|uniref:Dehydrogenase/reductase n=1 Tax=Podospora australis TaxID=1536484 RepID=A0AAN7AFB0_9PEZI|nr:hypothetical protein QBC35DRAFT_29413 [Podospora australis]
MSIKALVVGGTSGIGYGLACRVAAEAPSSSVIISGRNKPPNIPHPNMQFLRLDASSMREIKKYTDSFKASHADQKLDFLIMTQGVISLDGRTETTEGIDRNMALYYYGKQLLIRELLPVLKEDAKVIIVLNAKAGHPDKLNWNDLDLKKTFSLMGAASHCFTMTDGMIQQFAHQQQQAGNARRHFIHVYPGFVSTNISSSLPWYLRGPSTVLMRTVGVSPDTCAAYLLKGASEATAAAEKKVKFWNNIDQKGHEVAGKAVWTEDQRKKVEDHTWNIIDQALKVTARRA